MAAAKDGQLLDITALNNKLGGSNTGEEILDADEIISGWGSSVYIANGLTGKVIPNNWEVCPQTILRFGSSNTAALTGSDMVVHFRNSSWDSANTFVINTSCTIYNSQDAASGAGNYLDIINGSPSGYTFYKTDSSGKISSTGIFVPHYFNWVATGDDSTQIIELPTTNVAQVCSFSTSETSLSIYKRYLISANGQTSSTTTSSTYASATISSSNGTLTLKRSGILTTSGVAKPFVIVMMKGKHDNIDYYHSVLGAPQDSYWTLSTSNKTVNDTYQSSVGISVTTNMGGGWRLSKASNVDWVNINEGGQSLEIMGNGTYDSRSTTINVSDQINVTFRNIDSNLDEITYQGLLHTTSFTLTQEGMVRPPLGVVLFPTRNIESYYLVNYSNASLITWEDIDTYLINAPEAISIGTITIRVGLTQSSAPDLLNYIQYTSTGATINKNNNTGFIMWSQESDSGGPIYHENGDIKHERIAIESSYVNAAIQESSINVSWSSTQPSGWQLNNQLIIK